MHVLDWISPGDTGRRRRQIDRLSVVLEQLAVSCTHLERTIATAEHPAELRRLEIRLDVARRQYRKGLKRLDELERQG